MQEKPKIRRLTKEESIGPDRKDFRSLLTFLNQPGESSARERVLSLMLAIKIAEHLAVHVDLVFSSGKPAQLYSRTANLPMTKTESEYWDTVRGINEMLSRYKFSPSLTFKIHGRWRPIWLPLGGGEEEAVIAVLGAAFDGCVERINRCRRCGLWFFGRRGAVSCGVKCRQAAYRASENGKATRADYMRTYMARRRKGEV